MHNQCYLCVCVCLWPIAPRAKLSQNWSWPSNMFFLFCLVILLPWSWFNWVWLSWFWCFSKPKIPMDKILRAGPGINFQFKHQHVPTSLGWNSCTDLQDTYGLNFGPESGIPKKRLKVGLEPKSFSQGPQRGITMQAPSVPSAGRLTQLSSFGKFRAWRCGLHRKPPLQPCWVK